MRSKEEGKDQGIDTIKYHTRPRTLHRRVTQKTQENITYKKDKRSTHFQHVTTMLQEHTLHYCKDNTSNKQEDLKVLRRSPDLLYNVKIGQGQLKLIMKQILFNHIWGCSHFGQAT